MVLPSHLPPLAWGWVVRGWGRRPGGGAAEANRRFACPPVRRAACGPVAGLLQRAAGGKNGIWWKTVHKIYDIYLQNE